MKFLPFSIIFLASIFLVSCGTTETPFAKLVCYKWEVATPKFDFAKYVDPMIGTAGHGHTFPGATAPFGMVQLSPDTRVDGSWDGCSGYHYDDSIIYGFSHTHLSGTGCSDYGDILLMPNEGTPDQIYFTNGAKGEKGYASTFLHRNETSEAGYYKVHLDNWVDVELTASPRVGMHRYTFINGLDNWVLLDLEHRDEVVSTHLEIVNDSTVRGYRFSKAWATDQRLWFYISFSKPFIKSTCWSNGKTFDADSSSAKDLKAVFTFDKGDEKHKHDHRQVLVKVALSPVSWENAKLNMDIEIPDWDFDAVHKKVVQQWNNELGKIEVKTTDERKKKIFYTALYHCFIAPNIYCDVNGEYRGMDNKIHSDTIHPQYTVFSLWDTYRALHPLFTIIQPKRDQDFINTFVKQAQEGGTLPVWELSANETNCMIGYHSVPVIVDAWMKGLTDFDTATAYEAMKNSAMQGTRGLDAYQKFGFIPAEGESESVSKTLEYAYDDWCIALAAKRMKNDVDYQYFMRRAQSWKNLYDPKTGFFRPRLNNSFVEPFDPSEVNFHYTEANAWQYSLAVQQDIPGLIEAHGGDKKFIAFLDSLFSHSSKTSGRDQADITGLIGQYAQGNEPSHHMAYLYDFTSEPWKTQQIVSRICNEMYTDKPDGLCGNEDCGQMSAWYVMSMLGMYQVSPCSGQFAITAPGFDEIRINLENEKIFNITNSANDTIGSGRPDDLIFNIVINRSGALPFTGSTETGLHRFVTPFLEMKDVLSGGNYFFTSLIPLNQEKYSFNFQSAIGKEIPLPPLVILSGELNGKFPEFNKVAKGEITIASQRTFKDKMMIYFWILPNHENALYTSINNSPFAQTSDELTIGSSSIIKAFTVDQFDQHSDTVGFSYLKIPGGRSINLNSQFANQYSAGGNNALIDGIRGAENYRTGDWQGYEGKNLDAVIDLGATKNISHIAIGFLQDQNAWIFMPDEVTFYSSIDGKNFTEIGKSKNTISQNHDGPILHDFYVDTRGMVPQTKARYIKVVAKNIGTCPSWHPGKGKPSWIFCDEIIIN